MNEYAISTRGLSKRYRIGEEEHVHDTFVGAVTDFVKRPIKNLKRLRRLSVFDEEDSDSIIWALRDITMDVQEGEIVGIIGRNGAGKSTLLKVLSRITRPTTGRVELNGRVSSLLEVGTGFHPELTGRENVYLNGAILGMTKAEIDRKFDAIVEFSGVRKFVDTPVKRYSSGMRVRLAFSVAAHLEPEILIVDEVLSVGDAAFQKKSLGKMGEVSKSGRTVLFVSHNLAAVSALCTRCIVLEEGEMIYDGDVRTAIETYLGMSDDRIEMELSEREDRSGLGGFQFTRMRIEDETGRAVTSVRSGQELFVTLDYTSSQSEPIKAAKAIVLLSHKLHGPVVTLKSAKTGDLEQGIPPEGRLRCHIPRLPLMPGSYGITVAMKIGSDLADRIEDAGTIQIDKGDFFGTGKLPTGGLFIVDHEWSIDDEGAAVSTLGTVAEKRY